ncbi:cell wall integrity and stress response component 4 [Drosophila innubila]|uniref:cell wall integrity and stress response component 4 n=1 Tax=Drosophila innubila TaxID=198719 RepID=UPI00148C6AF6|nr:cell wall integrity and stress response component 4 [Drosophila innubila]
MLLPQSLVLVLMMLLTMLQVLQVQMQPVDNVPVEPVPEDDNNNSNIESLGRVLYDQRQTGKYNIHVSIKDVAIIEVDQNELADESYNAEDDDYYYDDSALTIKPIKFTTEASPTTTTTTRAPTTTASTTTEPSVAATVATVAAVSGNISAYSAQLLADIAATQRQKPKTNNLIIMDMPTESSSTLPSKWLQARSKDEPITTTTTAATASQLSNIEYTPSQGHDSPIFKVKVQRAANPTPTAETPSRCRTHQFRDAHGKCRTKRSGSILRKLFGMLVSLPFAGNRHGHGLQVSPP